MFLRSLPDTSESSCSKMLATAAVEARVVLGITMQVSGIVVILWVAERVLFYCSSFT